MNRPVHRKACDQPIVLRATISYPGSRVSDVLIGAHKVQIPNESLRAALTGCRLVGDGKPAETSDAVSRTAADLLNITQREISEIVHDIESNRLPELVRDIRSVAASALRQDERPGWWARLTRGG
jgi:hypothetical protein